MANANSIIASQKILTVKDGASLGPKLGGTQDPGSGGTLVQYYFPPYQGMRHLPNIPGGFHLNVIVYGGQSACDYRVVVGDHCPSFAANAEPVKLSDEPRCHDLFDGFFDGFVPCNTQVTCRSRQDHLFKIELVYKPGHLTHSKPSVKVGAIDTLADHLGCKLPVGEKSSTWHFGPVGHLPIDEVDLVEGRVSGVHFVLDKIVYDLNLVVGIDTQFKAETIQVPRIQSAIDIIKATFATIAASFDIIKATFGIIEANFGLLPCNAEADLDLHPMITSPSK